MSGNDHAFSRYQLAGELQRRSYKTDFLTLSN